MSSPQLHHFAVLFVLLLAGCPTTPMSTQPSGVTSLSWPAEVGEVVGEWTGLYIDNSEIHKLNMTLRAEGASGDRVQLVGTATVGEWIEGGTRRAGGQIVPCSISGSFDAETRTLSISEDRGTGTNTGLRLSLVSDGRGFGGTISTLSTRTATPFVAYPEDLAEDLVDQAQDLSRGRRGGSPLKVKFASVPDDDEILEWVEGCTAEVARESARRGPAVTEYMASFLAADRFAAVFDDRYRDLSVAQHSKLFAKLTHPTEPLSRGPARTFSMAFSLGAPGGVRPLFVEAECIAVQRRWLSAGASRVQSLPQSPDGLSIAQSFQTAWQNLLAGLPQSEVRGHIGVVEQRREDMIVAELNAELDHLESQSSTRDLLVELDAWGDETRRQRDQVRGAVDLRWLQIWQAKLEEWVAQEEPRLQGLPSDLSGIREGSTWLRELLQDVEIARGNEAIWSAVSRLKPVRERSLETCFEDLKGEIGRCSSDADLDNLLADYLAIPGDLETKVGSNLSTLVLQRRDQLDLERAKARFSEREREWMVDGLRIDVARGVGAVPTADEIALAHLREFARLSGRWIGDREVELQIPALAGMFTTDMRAKITAEDVSNIVPLDNGLMRFDLTGEFAGNIFPTISGLSGTVEREIVLTESGWRAPKFGDEMVQSSQVQLQTWELLRKLKDS